MQVKSNVSKKIIEHGKKNKNKGNTKTIIEYKKNKIFKRIKHSKKEQ